MKRRTLAGVEASIRIGIRDAPGAFGKTAFFIFIIILCLFFILPLSNAGVQGQEISAAGRLDECCDEECYQEMCQNIIAGLSKDCDIKIKDDQEKLCSDGVLRDYLIFSGESGKSCKIDCDDNKISATCDEDFDVSQDAICRQVGLDLKECGIRFMVDEEDEQENACGC